VKEKNGLLIASAVMFSVSLLLQIMARKVPGFGEWYARSVYPVFVGSLGRLSGLFPFALFEILIYILIFFCISYVIRYFREKKKILISSIFLLTLLFFLFTINCGINYYRKPFSAYSGLNVRKSSLEELKSLCVKLTVTLNQMSSEGITEELDMATYRAESVKSMKKLGEVYPELSGFYPEPKPLAWSYLFSIQQLCGQYSPFTTEAIYNRSMPDYNIPHTVCHELSHLRGFMREDEANFIGYLACVGSEDDAFRYSGYLTGWIYATNALAKSDPVAYAEVSRQLSDQIWVDLRYNTEFWGKYEGKTAEVANQLNDTYLKLNSQTDGVDSYGRMVDLMLAYERAGIMQAQGGY
jgi:hypothetical protein